MKRKTMVVSTAAPIENRTMRFRPKDPSPGRARALVAKPKVESAPETEAPPPVPLPALTDKIYCAHVFEIDGFEPIEIKPGAAGYCTIAPGLISMGSKPSISKTCAQ